MTIIEPLDAFPVLHNEKPPEGGFSMTRQAA